jgi:hypothetical protein
MTSGWAITEHENSVAMRRHNSVRQTVAPRFQIVAAESNSHRGAKLLPVSILSD